MVRDIKMGVLDIHDVMKEHEDRMTTDRPTEDLASIVNRFKDTIKWANRHPHAGKAGVEVTVVTNAMMKQMLTELCNVIEMTRIHVLDARLTTKIAKEHESNCDANLKKLRERIAEL